MGTLQDIQILLIDDDPDIRLLAKKFIEPEGAKLLEADSLSRAKTITATARPDLILTDLNMPGETGFDVLNYFKKDPTLGKIPILIVSSHTDKDAIMRAISMGAKDIVVKPFDKFNLLQKLRKHLGLGSAQRKTFDPKSRPKIDATVSSEIIMGNENGIVLESPVKLASRTEVTVAKSLFNSIECPNARTRTTTTPARGSGKGKFVSEISFIGMPAKAGEKLRKIFGGAG